MPRLHDRRHANSVSCLVTLRNRLVHRTNGYRPLFPKVFAADGLHSLGPSYAALLSARPRFCLVSIDPLPYLFLVPCLFAVSALQLDALAKAHPNQFKLWYTVDRPSDGWKFDKVRTPFNS